MLCRVTHASLHYFCDASESAAAAVSYMKMQTDDNNCHFSLVLSKSKLTLIKRLTMPRLELLSAMLAVHNDIFLRRELDIELDESKFYTDSMISLYYLNNEKKPLKNFVANRVALIRNHTSPKQWTHIQSHLNIADMACRGESYREFLGCSHWKKDLDLLRDSVFPATDYDVNKFSNVLSLLPWEPELKKAALTCTATNANSDGPEALSLNFFSEFQNGIK